MKKTYKLLILILILGLVVTGCKPTEDQKIVKDLGAEEKEIEDQELLINLAGGDWGYPNPYSHYSRGPGMFKMQLIFDSLLERGEEGYIPFLAESYDIEEDGLKYRFKLREGLTWHDGEELSPEDVKFSIEYFREHPPVLDNLGLWEDDFIEEIKIDGQEIEIKVREKNASLLERLGSFRIVPKHIWENVEEPEKFLDQESVIGSGPFKLADYNKEQGAYSFVKNDQHFSKVKVDRLNFIPVSDEILAFENGQIDISNISPDLRDRYEDNENFELYEKPGFWGYKLVLNMAENEKLRDKEVRQAIYYGLDREEMIEKVARGLGQPANAGYLPLEHKNHNPNTKKYSFQGEKARDLLAGEKLKLSLICSDDKKELRLAELMKLSLREIGIDLELKSMDGKARDSAVKSGDYELALIGHGGWGGDPDILRQQYGNIEGYENPELMDLLEAQLYETDEEKREKLVYEIQEILAEELPLLPLYNTVGLGIYNKNKYDGWKNVFNHHEVTHNKISYIELE